MSEIIRVENLSKSYIGKKVLKDLSLTVPQCSVMGLLGRNGSGKTTLIKCLLGLLAPDNGVINVFGEDVWTLSEDAKAKIGYVPQTSTFYPWLNIEETINYTASFYPRWNKELVRRLVDEWDLKLTDKPTLLSEGQAQKLSIILALGLQPELLILDEPIASLDPMARRKFLKEILEIISNRECTILFSTHITSDLERIADYIGILEDGKMIFADELDKLKEQVKCLKIHFPQNIPEPSEIPGFLGSKVWGRQSVIYVKNFEEATKKQIESRWNATVEEEFLNLEEILVEMFK